MAPNRISTCDRIVSKNLNGISCEHLFGEAAIKKSKKQTKKHFTCSVPLHLRPTYISKVVKQGGVFKVYDGKGGRTVPCSVMFWLAFHKVAEKLSRWDISAAFFQERNNDPVCPVVQVLL